MKRIKKIDGTDFIPYSKYLDLEEKYKGMLKLYSDAGEEIKKLKEANEMLKKQVSDDELYNKLCEIDNRCGSDTEARHVEADELLTECLRTLGFNKAMDKYDKMEFRYA